MSFTVCVKCVYIHLYIVCKTVCLFVHLRDLPNNGDTRQTLQLVVVISDNLSQTHAIKTNVKQTPLIPCS